MRAKNPAGVVQGYARELMLLAAVAGATLVGLSAWAGPGRAAVAQALRDERLTVSMKDILVSARRAESDLLLSSRRGGAVEPAQREIVAAFERDVTRVPAILADLERARPAGAQDFADLRTDLDTYRRTFEEEDALIAQAVPSQPAGSEARANRKTEELRAAGARVEQLATDLALRALDHAATAEALRERSSRRASLYATVFLALLALALVATHRRDLSPPTEATAPVAGTSTIVGTMTGRLRGIVSSLEQALSGSQRLLQSIIDTSTAVIHVKDLEGRYLLVNRRFEDVFHVKNDGVRGKTDHDLFPAAMADDYRSMDKRALSEERSLETEEVAPQDDGLHTYIATRAPLLDAEGTPYAVCGIWTDITARKLVEEQLRQSQKMEAIGSLAGGIAHDFNNLLMVINGCSGVLLSATDRSDEAYAPLLAISNAGDRAAALTRQLLVYSRRQVLAPRLWDLNTIVIELQPVLGRMVGDDIDLRVSLAPNVGPVVVDRVQVEQLLLNLVANGREAMSEGGVLTVQTAAVTLHERATELGSALGPHSMLAVSDTGVGMAPEVRARVFEPFFTTRPVGKGTGLGLSVVYGIVKQSGGSIAVQSEAGAGTTFRLYFPVAQGSSDLAAVAPADASGPETEAKGGTETILLVEDDDSVRHFIRNVLEGRGYALVEAPNGREALTILENPQNQFGLVISDVVMPQLGGRALSKWLLEHRPSLPVLFISGYADGANHVSTPAEPPAPTTLGEAVLQKPFSPSELCRRVRQRLDGRP